MPWKQCKYQAVCQLEWRKQQHWLWTSRTKQFWRRRDIAFRIWDIHRFIDIPWQKLHGIKCVSVWLITLIPQERGSENNTFPCQVQVQRLFLRTFLTWRSKGSFAPRLSLASLSPQAIMQQLSSRPLTEVARTSNNARLTVILVVHVCTCSIDHYNIITGEFIHFRKPLQNAKTLY